MKLRAFVACSDLQVGRRKLCNDDTVDMDSPDPVLHAPRDWHHIGAEVLQPAPGKLTVVFVT